MRRARCAHAIRSDYFVDPLPRVQFAYSSFLSDEFYNITTGTLSPEQHYLDSLLARPVELEWFPQEHRSLRLGTQWLATRVPHP